ncbi:MAG: dimethyl sulfoxide reductase anchor subunit [Eggerthellaceae bacterium]|nr:dimethyl sulfoxide reductase anchor subunit [Eggerthellaceae bacterium]
MELHWPLIIFTTLIAWSAGLFATQCIFALKGGAKKAQKPAWIVAAILLVVGGIAVFFHLGNAGRIFNGFGHLSSGITQELIFMVVLAVVAVIYLVLMLRSEDRASVPAWIAIVGIIASAALVFIMAHSYLMAARPAWNSFLWVLYVLGNACAFGPATLAALMAAKGDDMSGVGIVVLVGTLVALVTAVAYAIFVQTSGGNFAEIGNYMFDSAFPNREIPNAAAALSGVAGLLWGGAVAVGAVVPAVLAFVAKGKTDKSWLMWGCIIAALVLIGAICMRLVFFKMGLGVFMFF